MEMFISNTIIHSCCYGMLFITAWRSKVNKAEQLVYHNGALTSNPQYLLAAHLTGIFWMGIVPVIMFSQQISQVVPVHIKPSGNAMVIFLILLLLAAFIISKQGKNIRSRIISSGGTDVFLTTAFFLKYFIIRFVFLFCYELWFRGILLFDNINQLGMLPAVTLNVLTYVLLHIFKSKKEILACIPFGIAACCLSILFKTAWPAIVLHICVSAVYELPVYKTYSVTILNKKS